MTDLTRTPARTLAERLRAKLAEQPGQTRQAGDRILLLDTSGSMAWDAGDGRTKIEALRQLAAEVRAGRTYQFNEELERVHFIDDELGAQGQTYLGAALVRLRAAGAAHIVLVTDGLPTDPEVALRAVRGLRLDIFYVGPPPQPRFLAELAKAAASGSAQSATLKREEQPKLRAAISGLLDTGRKSK